MRDLSGKVLRSIYEYADDTLVWEKDYIYQGSQLLSAAVPTRHKVLQYHLDHLGTPRLVTTNGGAELARLSYYPFGKDVTNQPATDTGKLKFTGHERDTTTLDYMHARYYNPVTGRFLSVDPGDDVYLSQPQSWNKYSYVRNNPVRFIDPTGLQCQPGEELGPDGCGSTVTAPDPGPSFSMNGFLSGASNTHQMDRRARGYTAFMRGWNSTSWTSSWNGLFERFGYYAANNPDHAALSIIAPMFRISNLRYLRGGRILRGNITQRGGVSAARAQFERLAGRSPRGASDQVELPNGTTVRFRASGSGGAKVEINDPVSGTYQKTTFRD